MATALGGNCVQSTRSAVTFCLPVPVFLTGTCVILTVSVPAMPLAADVTAQCRAYSTQCRAYGTRCRAYGTQCRAYDTQCWAYGTQCRVYSTQCRAYGTQCRAYSTQCRAYSTQCRAYGTQQHRDHIRTPCTNHCYCLST